MKNITRTITVTTFTMKYINVETGEVVTKSGKAYGDYTKEELQAMYKNCAISDVAHDRNKYVMSYDNFIANADTCEKVVYEETSEVE